MRSSERAVCPEAEVTSKPITKAAAPENTPGRIESTDVHLSAPHDRLVSSTMPGATTCILVCMLAGLHQSCAPWHETVCEPPMLQRTERNAAERAYLAAQQQRVRRLRHEDSEGRV